MIKRIATGIFALAATFAMLAGSAMAKEFDPKVSGVRGVTISHKSAPDKEVHYVTRRPLEGKGFKTDSVFWIQKSKNSKEYLTTDGKKVFWGPKQTNWTFHKNSTGWSLMLHDDEALAVSIKDGGLVLERNQGSPHQVWEIDQK